MHSHQGGNNLGFQAIYNEHKNRTYTHRKSEASK